MHFGYGLDMPQLSNLLMPYSVSKGFDTAMKTGIKTIQMIHYNLSVNFKLTSLYYGLRLIQVYPNPQ